LVTLLWDNVVYIATRYWNGRTFASTHSKGKFFIKIFLIDIDTPSLFLHV
jgi:hypothetical protein